MTTGSQCLRAMTEGGPLPFLVCSVFLWSGECTPPFTGTGEDYRGILSQMYLGPLASALAGMGECRVEESTGGASLAVGWMLGGQG